MWIGTTCRYLSDEWAAGPFVSYIRLEPVTHADRFPVDLIVKLTEYKGKFFKNYFQDWKHRLYYFLPQNDEYVKYFVLKINHRKTRLNPKIFFGKFRESLNSHWRLTIANRQFRFTARVHKFFKYDFTDSSQLIKSGSEFQPTRGIWWRFGLVDNKEDFELLKNVRAEKAFPEKFEVSVTNFFLCKQVVLRPTEYTVTPHRQLIYLNISQRFLEETEYRRYVDEKGNDSVSVCMETFGPDFWPDSGHPDTSNSLPWLPALLCFLTVLEQPGSLIS